MADLVLSDDLKRDLRDGFVACDCAGMRYGLRSVRRLWFNPASGHYVADAGSCFLWSEEGGPLWHYVHNSTRH